MRSALLSYRGDGQAAGEGAAYGVAEMLRHSPGSAASRVMVTRGAGPPFSRLCCSCSFAIIWLTVRCHTWLQKYRGNFDGLVKTSKAHQCELAVAFFHHAR